MSDLQPSSLQEAIDQYRQRVVDLDNAALSDLISSYATTRRRLIQRTNELARIVMAQGEKVTLTQILKLATVKRTLDTLEEELAQYGLQAEVAVRTSQAGALGNAERIIAGIALSQNRDVVWNRVNPQAVVAMLGRMQDGSPLKDLLENIAPNYRQAIEQELIDSITRGTNVRDVGKRLANLSTIPLTKATQISTDAILGSYRNAAFASIQANADVLEGWIWGCAYQARTCAFCLSMGGKEFPVSKGFMEAHSRCRCTPIPKVKGSSLSLPDGDQWLRNQSPSVQEQVLGKKAATIFRSGSLHLDDFAEIKIDPKWGPSGQQASLERAVLRAQSQGRAATVPSTAFQQQSSGSGGSSSGSPGSGGSSISGAKPTDVSAHVRYNGPNTPAYISETLAAIDAIHTDGSMARTRVHEGLVDRGKANGKFNPITNRITVDPARAGRKMTFAHELGHAIDSAFGNGQTFASYQHPELDGWRSAIQQSNKFSQMVFDIQTTNNQDFYDYLQYALSPHELWARSYAQYVATRTSDPDLRADLRRAQTQTTYYPDQWDDSDFADIALAIDDALRIKGWIP